MAKVGRPLKFKKPEEILNVAAKYFEEMIAKNQPITVTGLCMALDTTRDVLMDYQDERGEEFSNAVKKCKLVCENFAENQLYKGNPTGPIFALKNFGWKDKQEIDLGDSEKLDEVRNKLNNLIEDVKTGITPTNSTGNSDMQAPA